MSSQEFFDRLCKLLCELDKLVKEYLFGKARQCNSDCNVED
jgi:hypothetical protein